MNTKPMTFPEYSDAREWADSVGRVLEPCGTISSESVLREWKSVTGESLFLVRENAEYLAEGSRGSVFCLIACYKVIIGKNPDNESEYDIDHADSREDAESSFDYWVRSLTN